jgi:hypothetical protein
MRITVSHNKPKEEIKQAVDRSFDDLLRNIGALPLRIANEQRSWSGSTLTFSLTAKMGLLSSPIKGTVEVTDRDVTIDADLGLIERLLSPAKTRAYVEGRVRGLLT